MTLFNFRSIQELEITESDNPKIDVQDGRLVLTAERNKEKIVITAPFRGVVPNVAATVVKAPKRSSKGEPTGMNLHVGSENGMAKLNEIAVKEIRMLVADESFKKEYKSLTAMYAAVGEIFNVSGWAIKNVAENISWKHVKN
jgi:hypothetical protein